VRGLKLAFGSIRGAIRSLCKYSDQYCVSIASHFGARARGNAANEFIQTSLSALVSPPAEGEPKKATAPRGTTAPTTAAPRTGAPLPAEMVEALRVEGEVCTQHRRWPSGHMGRSSENPSLCDGSLDSECLSHICYKILCLMFDNLYMHQPPAPGHEDPHHRRRGDGDMRRTVGAA